MNSDLILHKIIPANPFPPESFVFVDSLNDLPNPNESNVITLDANKTYYITTSVDLLGNRLVAGANTTILGASSENCILKSTGLVGTALLSSAWSIPIRNIAFECDVALSLDATGHANQAIDWTGVNFINCSSVGTIKNYTNVIISDGAFLNTKNIILDGSIGTVSFFQCIFDCSTNGTMINALSTLVISRRLRIMYSSFIALSGETALNVHNDAQIPVEAYILDTVSFAGGGSYTTGVQYTDNKSRFMNCNGIINSTNIGAMFWEDNGVATVISNQNEATKILGVSVASPNNQKFTHANNRLTSNGSITRLFLITATATLTSGNNQLLGLSITKSGNPINYAESHVTTSGNGRSENMHVQAITQIAENEYIELFCTNHTAVTNITATHMSVIITVLN